MRLRAFPRLHLGLIDCGAATRRIFGGVGVAVDAPTTEIRCQQSAAFSVSYVGAAVDARTKTDVERVVTRYRTQFGLPAVNLIIAKSPPEHVGLGSKTALLLSIATVLANADARALPPASLTQLTGRGGTSGIGVHSFFTGGWVADAGHRRDRTASLLPSSRQAPTDRPPALFSHPVSEEWAFHLLLPTGVARSGDAEAQFFGSACPIPDNEVLTVISIVYHSLLPAIVEDDLDAVADSLLDLRRTGFKHREITAQSSAVTNTLRLLDDARIPATMSSMGPVVVAITRHDDGTAAKTVRDIAEHTDSQLLNVTRGRNSGAIWEPYSDA